MNVHERLPIAEPAAAATGSATYDDVPAMPGDGGGVRALAGVVWRGRLVVAAAVLLALALALLAISQMRPVYRATAKVLFEAQQADIAGLDAVLKGDDARNGLQNQIEILSSTSLVERVVDRLDLMASREFNEALSPPDVSLGARLAGLVSWRTYVSPDVLADLGLIAPPTSPDPDDLARQQRFAVIGAVRKNLSLKPVPNSRVIAITFDAAHPRAAAAIANAVAEGYIDDQLEAKLAAARKASEWLGGRLEELRERVRNAELTVENARAAVTDKAGQTAEITAQRLAAINGALVGVSAQRTEIEAKAGNLAIALGAADTDLGAISVLRDAPVIASLRRQEADLRAQESIVSALARDNPGLVRVRAQLAVVRDDIRAEARRVLAALNTDLALARDREAALGAQLETLEATGAEQRRGEIELRQLEREAQASRTLYETFLARLQETTQQETLEVADARILSPAEVPAGPLATAKNRTLMLALVVGLCAGCGLVLLVDRLNNTYRSVEELERATGIAVLACLPSVGPDADRADVVRELHERPGGALAEAVRNLRTSLLFAGADTPRVIVFTSSTPQEGKSTSSLLLALTTQQMGRSAIIVDCDLRLSTLSAMVGGEPRPGLISVLDGRASLAEAIHVDPATGLGILATQPGERGTLSAADVVASERFADLVGELVARYDLVVIDTPPVLAVADARIVARLADAVVYVVRWDETPRGAVAEGLRQLMTVNAPLAGLVLTMVDAGRLGYAAEGYGGDRGRDQAEGG